MCVSVCTLYTYMYVRASERRLVRDAIAVKLLALKRRRVGGYGFIAVDGCCVLTQTLVAHCARAYSTQRRRGRTARTHTHTYQVLIVGDVGVVVAPCSAPRWLTTL